MSSNLTNLQRAFVEYYLQNGFNATLAAKQAGYKAKNDDTYRAIGSENLTKPNIAYEVERRMNELAMSADEALFRLASIARGDIGDYLSIDDYDGRFINVDLKKAKQEGKTWLLKSYQGRSKTQAEKIELYDAQRALETILKVHGRLNQTLNVKLDWQIEITQALQDGLLTIDELRQELGDELANEFFAAIASSNQASKDS